MVSFILFRLEHRSGKFWESLTDIANTLKLRVSYGELGNQNTTAWYPTYRDMILKSSNGTWLQDNQKPNTAEPGDLVSNSLTWEKSVLGMSVLTMVSLTTV